MVEPQPQQRDIQTLLKKSGSLALLVDHAIHVRDLSKLLFKVNGRKEQTALIMAARPHEWNHTHGHRPDLLIRDLPKVNIENIDNQSATLLAKKLLEAGASVEKDPETLAKNPITTNQKKTIFTRLNVRSYPRQALKKNPKKRGG